MREFAGWTATEYAMTPADVVSELREIYLEVNPHLRPAEDAAANDYELKKVVNDDGIVTKRRDTAPASQTLYGLFGKPKQRKDG